jgi:hypothetical protein
MSAKGTYRDLRIITNVVSTIKSTVYQAETENEDWNNIPTNTPILAQGSGSYSEQHFGFYVGTGKITKLSMNAYPVVANSTFTIKIKALDKNYNEQDLIV